jgi:GT2 family glycosyltransferase/glycosyltransferase involved in cell wall biosynthesis
MPAGLRGEPASAAADPGRPVAVVIPAYRGAAQTRTCLEAVRATAPAGTVVLVVDDASPEPDLATLLDDAARDGRITLHRHARNQGFPGAANAGLRAAAALPGMRDVVLLNSDTVPAAGWLGRLRAAVHSAGDIGTACPLSNDASILGYTDPARPGPATSGDALAGLAGLAAGALDGVAVEIPTAVGFCMYIRRECLLATGLLRTDLFAQGYGEENDFSLRARRLGWRHVAVPGAYVAHAAGTSFGAARAALLARNLDVLERLHPGYRALIAEWQQADPLAEARRRLDAARLRARMPEKSVLLVTHDGGGGVERVVRARAAALEAQGIAAILLRPVVATEADPSAPQRRYRPGLCLVGEADAAALPNLRFRLPEELPELARLLGALHPSRMEVHHMVGHHRAVLELPGRLGIPFEAHLHDYAAICPRVTLTGAERRYCGEPEVEACEACVADLGGDIEEDIGPRALRARSAEELAQAGRVVVPSADMAARLRRHFPAVMPVVEPLEDDTDLPPLRPWRPGATRRVGIVGAIGTAKGYDVLLACARDAARRDLPLSFVLIGHSEDDARLMDTGRVFVTGPYREDDGPALLAEQGVDFAFLPAVWPETWCFALGLAWRAGLAAALFDLGAPAERVRRTGRGWVLPLGLSAAGLNAALLALDDPARMAHAAALQVRTGDVSLAAGVAVPATHRQISVARR